MTWNRSTGYIVTAQVSCAYRKRFQRLGITAALSSFLQSTYSDKCYKPVALRVLICVSGDRHTKKSHLDNNIHRCIHDGKSRRRPSVDGQMHFFLSLSTYIYVYTCMDVCMWLQVYTCGDLRNWFPVSGGPLDCFQSCGWTSPKKRIRERRTPKLMSKSSHTNCRMRLCRDCNCLKKKSEEVLKEKKTRAEGENKKEVPKKACKHLSTLSLWEYDHDTLVLFASQVRVNTYIYIYAYVYLSLYISLYIQMYKPSYGDLHKLTCYHLRKQSKYEVIIEPPERPFFVEVSQEASDVYSSASLLIASGHIVGKLPRCLHTWVSIYIRDVWRVTGEKCADRWIRLRKFWKRGGTTAHLPVEIGTYPFLLRRLHDYQAPGLSPILLSVFLAGRPWVHIHVSRVWRMPNYIHICVRVSLYTDRDLPSSCTGSFLV